MDHDRRSIRFRCRFRLWAAGDGECWSWTRGLSRELQSDDTDLAVEFSLDKVPVGGTAGVDQSFLIRRVANQGDYRLRSEFWPRAWSASAFHAPPQMARKPLLWPRRSSPV